MKIDISEDTENNITIYWNGFIEQCITNSPDEGCAFLFAKKP